MCTCMSLCVLEDQTVCSLIKLKYHPEGSSSFLPLSHFSSFLQRYSYRSYFKVELVKRVTAKRKKIVNNQKDFLLLLFLKQYERLATSLAIDSYRSPFQGSNEMEMKVALILSVRGYVLKKICNINGILHQKT